jgi:curved DNA-binding protein CbpA
LLSALILELESLSKLNPFQVLGVGYDATDEAIRAAFAELTKRYHPDRYIRYTSTSLRTLAAEIFIVLRNAYERLGDETSRAKALASLGVRATVRVPPATKRGDDASANRTSTPARPPPASRSRPGSRPAATKPQSSTRAAIAAPNQSAATAAVDDGRSDIHQAESSVEAGQYDEAIALYRRVARKQANNRSARAGVELCEGLKALAQRDRLEAAQRFELVLEIDPTNERAARELAEMRRLATNERKGLLSRLMVKRD